MIEKMFGCAMVLKLRSILLMDADFNFANKTIFGTRMMGNARKYKLIPDEICSEKNKTAEDGTLAKILFMTYHDKHADRQGLPQLTRITALIGLHTQWQACAFRPLV